MKKQKAQFHRDMNLSEKIIDMNRLVNTSEDFYPDLKDKSMLRFEDVRMFIRKILNKISARVDFKTEKDYEKCMETIKEFAGGKLYDI